MGQGRVFTPPQWARWAVGRHGIYEQWRAGATVIDPTCGEGVFLEVLIGMAVAAGGVSAGDLQRLHGVERHPPDRAAFLHRIKRDYGIDFPPANFRSMDYLDFRPEIDFDIAVGNPPWLNFTDLAAADKERAKAEFVRYGLVANRKAALLGNSRTEMAALIIAKCMREAKSGYFFVPLSLFFNEGANELFRPAPGTGPFSVREIVDFDTNAVFPAVGARNGFAAFKREVPQTFPIPLRKAQSMEAGTAMWCHRAPAGGAWMQSDSEKPPQLPRIVSTQPPRQGMNTGGCNRILHIGDVGDLEPDFLLPLMNSSDFGGRPKPRRHILCLHGTDGKPAGAVPPNTLAYLERHRAALENRKGVLVRRLIDSGAWHAMLGVGPYCFAPYKVAWEAYGRREFKAVVLDGRLQGNSSMHAYIPADTLAEAERLRNELNAKVPAYLALFGMAGTCNWAQPGRIKRIIAA